MEFILGFLRSDLFLGLLGILIIILFILYISTILKLNKLRNSYSTFMNKLGNGKDIDETLKNYISRVEEVEKASNNIVEEYNILKENVAKCTQKIGMVRYNAFRDTGSDLSFSLALLDNNNNGVILNGIYGRDNSNIYAKPVENGISKYTLTEEEKEAIYKAVNS